VTPDGYVGLAPAETQIGDIVFLFLRAHVCYLLRKIVDPKHGIAKPLSSRIMKLTHTNTVFKP
jgi:hypothetical protein